MPDFDVFYLTDAAVDAVRNVITARQGNNVAAVAQFGQLGECLLRRIGLFDGVTALSAQEEASLREFAQFRGSMNWGASAQVYSSAIVAYFTDQTHGQERKRALNWLRNHAGVNPVIPNSVSLSQDRVDPLCNNSRNLEAMVASQVVGPNATTLTAADFAVLPALDSAADVAAYDAALHANIMLRDTGGYFTPPAPANPPGGETGAPGGGVEGGDSSGGTEGDGR